MPLQSSTMVERNVEIYPSEMTEKAHIIIHHGGENVEIFPSEMTHNAPIIIHHGWRNF